MGNWSFDDLKYLPINHYEFPDLLLTKNDLLFNRTNSAELVGKTAVYEGGYKLCSFASYLIRVRLLSVHPLFLSFYINSAIGKKWISDVKSQQVGQANINGTKLKALKIPLPPIREIEEIVRRCQRQFSYITDCNESLIFSRKLIENTRQSILKAAFLR